MSELPYFDIHLRKHADSISQTIADDESDTTENTLRALGVKCNTSKSWENRERWSVYGTTAINRELIQEALEKQLPGVVITIENQEDFAHEKGQTDN